MLCFWLWPERQFRQMIEWGGFSWGLHQKQKNVSAHTDTLNGGDQCELINTRNASENLREERKWPAIPPFLALTSSSVREGKGTVSLDDVLLRLGAVGWSTCRHACWDIFSGITKSWRGGRYRLTGLDGTMVAQLENLGSNSRREMLMAALPSLPVLGVGFSSDISFNSWSLKWWS